MNAWVEAYNHAPIDTALPNQEVVRQIKDANIVIASILSRTADSLALIGVEPREKNSLFNEIDLPETNGTILKLSPKTWLVILRVLMLLGFGKNSKIYKQAKQRAIKASAYLVELANRDKSIALMGHGGMNWLLGKELKKQGFKVTKESQGSKNWGYKVYER